MLQQIVSGLARPLLVALVMVGTVPRGAGAQESSAPNAQVVQVRAGVAELGRQWNRQVEAQTARLYARIQREHPPSGLRELRRARYGAKSWQTLDVYFPGQGFDALGPVFVFLHGDAEAEGAGPTAQTSAELYANAARSLARFGGVGINANFRQSPQAKWPSGVDDIHALLDWTRKHVAKQGGDPASIIVLGSGEGALHLATYLLDQSSQFKDGPGIAGAILGSGTFDPGSDPAATGRYFGPEDAAYRPLDLVDSYRGKTVPILMWSAQYDPLESGVAEMRDKLCQKYGACPMFVELAGHNHVSPVMSIDSLDVSVAAVIVRFYHSAVRK